MEVLQRNLGPLAEVLVGDAQAPLGLSYDVGEVVLDRNARHGQARITALGHGRAFARPAKPRVPGRGGRPSRISARCPGTPPSPASRPSWRSPRPAPSP